MITLIQKLINFIYDMQYEHEQMYEDMFNNYTTYETLDDAYIIATNMEYTSGLYVNEYNYDEYFYKKMMNDGMYAIGINADAAEQNTVYVSTNDGGMVKDSNARVSTHSVEIHLTNISSLEHEPFKLFKVETDNKINVILWYRRENELPVVNKRRGRRKKNV